MKRFRAAFAMLALCLLTAIDPRPSFAETYRPWCVQYPTSDATSCAFHLIRTMHDDGGPRHRRFVRAEPVVPVVRPEQPQHGPGRPGEEMIGPTCQLAHARRHVHSHRAWIAGVEAVTDALMAGEERPRWI